MILAALVFGVSFPLRADVLLLQSGAVVAGKVLQQDANGVLMQTEAGTYRYPQAWIKDVKKEAATAPHVSNNGQAIPDWAQIVTLLADSGFAPEIKQVPAPVISYGNFKNVPYLSFRCAYGGYEINIFGDLNRPAAVQIGAMGYLKDHLGILPAFYILGGFAFVWGLALIPMHRWAFAKPNKIQDNQANP